MILTILTRSKAQKIKILRDKLSELSCEIDKADISTVIVHNIREFMTHKKKGRDNVTSMQAKQAILTACTYTQSGNTLDLDKIRDVIGMSKNTFYIRKVPQQNDDMNTYRLAEGS